ncbi:MAG: endolytic transglycosylase MltG [Schleiferiaceae bacterium]
MSQRSRKSRRIRPWWLAVVFALAAAVVGLWPSQDFSSEPVVLRVPEDGTPVLDVLDSVGAKNPDAHLNLLRLGGMLQGNFAVPRGYYEISPSEPWWRSLRRLKMGYETPRSLVVRGYQGRDALVQRLAATFFEPASKLDSALFGGDSIVPVLPNTYEVYASLTPNEVAERMGREFDAFWNAPRSAAAAELGLSRYEVTVLASIVQAESKEPEEWPRIAGVYLTRLKQGKRLEADPTVVYAVLDRGLAPAPIRRVTGAMLRVAHPFNTYRNKGLPPGPLATVHPPVIDSVLASRATGELFFCANPLKPGFHLFSKSYAEHLRNRSRYLKAITR